MQMMFSKTSLIITSIAAPNAVMRLFAAKCMEEKIDFIVIGDTKSPADFKLEGCKFVSIEEQKKLPFKLAKLLPEKHYGRKNLGYLLAKHQDVIIETDDDNFPKENFWNERAMQQNAKHITNAGWVNVYKYFSKENIWARGFPLEKVHKSQATSHKSQTVNAPIQQGLADENPDVDAVFRMTQKLPLNFDKGESISLGKNSWSPFNSQNTTWFKEAFPLLYLPSYCSFRMTDIWRSFIAQRIAWTCDWNILFHQSTVWQERNEHNLLKDFEDEVPGYLNNSRICKLLEELDLKNGAENICENLIRCYRMMTEEKFVGEKEMELVEGWCGEFLQ
jgi:hypothetical protein